MCPTTGHDDLSMIAGVKTPNRHPNTTSRDLGSMIFMAPWKKLGLGPHRSSISAELNINDPKPAKDIIIHKD